jgi:hypothetical protein
MNLRELQDILASKAGKPLDGFEARLNIAKPIVSNSEQEEYAKITSSKLGPVMGVRWM